MKTMISTLKSLILINFVKKMSSGGPLAGVTLGGGLSPAQSLGVYVQPRFLNDITYKSS